MPCANIASRSSRSLHSTQTATPPSSAALATALISSTRPFQETRREMPLSGFRRLASGCSALGEKFQLPSRKGDTSAATIRAPNNGVNVSKVSAARSARRTSINDGSRARSWSTTNPRAKVRATRCTIHGPISMNAAAATMRTRKVPTSRERGTWPSSRACSRRLADAGSVRSRSLSSAISRFQSGPPHYKKSVVKIKQYGFLFRSILGPLHRNNACRASAKKAQGAAAPCAHCSIGYSPFRQALPRSAPAHGVAHPRQAPPDRRATPSSPESARSGRSTAWSRRQPRADESRRAP